MTEQRREERNMVNQKLRKLRYHQDEEVVEEACKDKNVMFVEIRNGNRVQTQTRWTNGHYQEGLLDKLVIALTQWI